MKKPNYIFSLCIIGVLYFIFGFVTWLNSLLIPFLKTACSLSDSQAYFVTFAFYISYFVMAIPSSFILKKTGFANGMSIGLLVMAIGALGFIPAAYDRSYMLFLVSLFVMGTGLSLLQTAVNPYVSILGPIESAAKRMSIMGLFNKIAGIVGILGLGAVLLSDYRDVAPALLPQRLVTPYIIMAVALVGVAITIKFAHLPQVNTDETPTDHNSNRRSIYRIPHLWLGIAALFLYVGVEVIAIDTLGLYAESQGIAKEVAPKLGAFSLVALTVGYIMGLVLVPKILAQDKALLYSAVLGFVFAWLALATAGWTSVLFIILLSFAHAVMWPAIFPLSIDGLGRHTALGSAFLIMAIAGGAVMPLLYGWWVTCINDRHLPYLILLPCYLFIFYFALRGHKAGRQ
ncbi:MAG: sugar MFS transporter [Bacteroidales bacterium]|nr:sugar MFS transporter [Bacteroidales bacterium]